MTKIWPHQSEVDAFYGDPRGKNGEASSAWERENIVRVKAPWALVTAWDYSPVSSIRIHQKCADSLSSILADIWASAGKSEARVKEWGMHLYAGGYNFRRMTGASRLSMHSWGCAIDFDSARNRYGEVSPNFLTIPAVLEAFAREAWVWGGRWHMPDGMHWQAAQL
jgi:hypothetical protein